MIIYKNTHKSVIVKKGVRTLINLILRKSIVRTFFRLKKKTHHGGQNLL